jgi:hypothetical protein
MMAPAGRLGQFGGGSDRSPGRNGPPRLTSTVLEVARSAVRENQMTRAIQSPSVTEHGSHRPVTHE